MSIGQLVKYHIKDHVETNGDDGRQLEDSTHAVKGSETSPNSHDQDSKGNGSSVSPPSHPIMAAKTHAWISLWYTPSLLLILYTAMLILIRLSRFLITVPVIFWDVGYCFMR